MGRQLNFFAVIFSSPHCNGQCPPVKGQGPVFPNVIFQTKSPRTSAAPRAKCAADAAQNACPGPSLLVKFYQLGFIDHAMLSNSFNLLFSLIIVYFSFDDPRIWKFLTSYPIFQTILIQMGKRDWFGEKNQGSDDSDDSDHRLDSILMILLWFWCKEFLCWW